MSEWQEVKLRECISTLKGFAFKSKWYQPDGVPIVRVSDFTDNSISVDDIEYIPHDLAQEHSRYLLKTKDVIIQTVGSWQHNPASIVGKVVNVPFNLNGALLNQNAVKIIPNKTIDNNFLYYRLKDEHFKLHNLGCAQGAANQASITLSSIGAFKFNLPPLPTQQKIAKILSNYDDLIENNLKRIKLLEESARLTYEEWFLRFRIDGKKLEIDPETKLPFGWMRKKAEEALNVNIGKTPPRGESHWFTSGGQGMKWISIKDMKQSSTYTFNSNEEITKDGVTKHNMNIAQAGVVLLSFKLTVGEVRITVNDVVTNEAIAHMNIKKDSVLFNEYIYSYLQSFNFDTLGSTSSIGTAINSKIVKAMPVIIPSNEILEKFKTTVVPTFSEINNLQHQNQLLKEARDILLPRLMTGMIDTDDMDIAV